MTTRSRRSAYTLLEVALVTGIIVLLSGLAYPSLRAMYGSYKMTGAVDSVRAAWAQARARAMEEGRPYRFSVESDGAHFRIAPDQADYWNGGSPSSDAKGKGLVMQKALPDGVKFTVNGDAASPPPPEVGAGSTGEGSGNWSTAVIFQPDGTAREDVRILFQVRGARATEVHLRGLTGTATVQTVQP